MWSQDSLAGVSLSSCGVTCALGRKDSLQERVEPLAYSCHCEIAVPTVSAVLCLGVTCEAEGQLSQRHRGQDSSYKRKHFIEGMLTVSEV